MPVHHSSSQMKRDNGPRRARALGCTSEALLGIWLNPIRLGHALGFKGLTEELHGESWRFARNLPRAYTELPRGHYKSTFWSIVIPIWIKMRDMSQRVMHMSAALGLGRDLEKSIVERIYSPLDLEGYEKMRLVDVFPWMRVSRYSRNYGIWFDGRTGLNKEPCIFSSSVDSAAEGKHPTVIICDDLSNRKNSATASQRAKVIRAYTLLTPIAERLNCPIWAVGTPWAFTDLSWHLKEIIEVPTFRRPVLLQEPLPGSSKTKATFNTADGYTVQGYPLAESILDEAGVRAMTEGTVKEDGTLDQSQRIPYEEFMSQYMLEPTTGDACMFSADVWNGTILTDLLKPEVANKGYEVAIVDPAAKVKDGAQRYYTGLVVYKVLRAYDVGFTNMDPATNIFAACEVQELKPGGDVLMRAIYDLAARRPMLRSVGIEQQGFIEMVRPWMARDMPRHVSLFPLRVTGNNSGGKDRRLQGLQRAMLQSRWVQLPEYPGQKILKDYLLRYPSVDHRDVLDAAALVSLLPRRGKAEPDEAPEVIDQSVAWHRQFMARNPVYQQGGRRR